MSRRPELVPEAMDVFRSFLRLSVLALSSATALAGVITVDDSGGADFTDLPAAVAAAADTLLVHPGTYMSFTLDGKPLTMLGLASGQVVVLGSTRVRDLAAGSPAVLCQLDCERLALSNNTAAVVLDDVRVFGEGSAILRVAACADVRAMASQVHCAHMAQGHMNSTHCAALVESGSRFEATESFFVGNTTAAQQEYGWDGLRVRGASRAWLAASSASGGKGGNERGCLFVCCPSYEGGYGVRVEESSSLHAAGTPLDFIEGGFQGYPLCNGGNPQSCPISVVGASASAVVSGVTLEPPWFCSSSGGTGSTVLPPVPWLERGPSPQAGGSVEFFMHGEPGDVVTLFLGRSAVVVPLPGVEVEKLTSEERSFDLGAIGAAGFVTFAMPTPLSMSQCFTFFGQARILRQGTELRTNSAPIALR